MTRCYRYSMLKFSKIVGISQDRERLSVGEAILLFKAGTGEPERPVCDVDVSVAVDISRAGAFGMKVRQDPF